MPARECAVVQNHRQNPSVTVCDCDSFRGLTGPFPLMISGEVLRPPPKRTTPAFGGLSADHVQFKKNTSYSENMRCLAEKEGFEPSRQLSHPTPLAGEPLRPLGYFSMAIQLAEREGFEPPVPFGITGFQDQRLKPLGHLS